MLAAAQTTLAKAAADLNRIKPLAEMKAVSEQDLDARSRRRPRPAPAYGPLRPVWIWPRSS